MHSLLKCTVRLSRKRKAIPVTCRSGLLGENAAGVDRQLTVRWSGCLESRILLKKSGRRPSFSFPERNVDYVFTSRQ